MGKSLKLGRCHEQLEVEVAANWIAITKARDRERTLIRQVANADSVLKETM